jgi:hypothetical protein
LIILFALLFPVSAHAEDCQLIKLASIDLDLSHPGVVLVHATINGTAQLLHLNLQAPFNYVFKDVAERLNLPQSDVVLRTSELALVLNVASMQISGIQGKDVQVSEGMRGANTSPDIAGGIGLAWLSQFDVELDLANAKLNLFRPDHCPGKVVYWTKAPVGIIEMRALRGGGYHYAFTLDGLEIDTAIETGSTDSTLPFVIASEKYRIHRNSDGVVLARPNGQDANVYRYPFKRLLADGVAIDNPEIYLWGRDDQVVCDGERHLRIEDINPYRCFGGADLNLGLRELQALHLFFAFSEKKLYVTAAGAH